MLTADGFVAELGALVGWNSGRDTRLLIGETPPQEIVQRGISQSPEGRRIFDRMSVRENLTLGRLDAAIETADVALMADELAKIPFAIRLSRAAARNIRLNIGFSLGLKAAFLVLAFASPGPVRGGR